MMIQSGRLVNTFFELVKIDSETTQEAAVCAHLKDRFAAFGMMVMEDDAAARTGHGSGNLIIDWPASEGMAHLPPVFFTSHFDTVVPGKGIRPRLDPDGYIRSDGTTILGSDDKAGLAAMIEAVQVIQEQQLPHGPVQFLLTVGEEAGLNGARAMDPLSIRAVMGFALDSNGPVGDIIVAAPTQAKIKMEVFGRSAHAGVNPEAGISAIQVASKAVAAMPLGRIDAETTANIGKFSGGGPTNIVCDYVALDAEARSLEPARMQEIVGQMRAALAEQASAAGAEYAFHDEVMYPGYRLSADDPVVGVAVRAASAIGREPKLLTSGGGSDANIFNGHGVPTVNLGIGYEHIHTTKEQIPLVELEHAARLVLAIIAAVCSGDRE